MDAQHAAVTNHHGGNNKTWLRCRPETTNRLRREVVVISNNLDIRNQTEDDADNRQESANRPGPIFLGPSPQRSSVSHVSTKILPAASYPTVPSFFQFSANE